MIRVCCVCRRQCKGSAERPEAFGRAFHKDQVFNVLVTHTYCVPCFELRFGPLEDVPAIKQEPRHV
jgi:hypothetical protein